MAPDPATKSTDSFEAFSKKYLTLSLSLLCGLHDDAQHQISENFFKDSWSVGRIFSICDKEAPFLITLDLSFFPNHFSDSFLLNSDWNITSSAASYVALMGLFKSLKSCSELKYIPSRRRTLGHSTGYLLAMKEIQISPKTSQTTFYFWLLVWKLWIVEKESYLRHCRNCRNCG